jgi:outer membrane protein assembly factor BamA
MLRYPFLILLLLYLNPLKAQVPNLYIKGIEVSGNKQSKKVAILSYLDFEIGDSLKLEELMPRLRKNERLLMNSRLFAKVEMNVGQWQGKEISIKIKVEESWYIFPLPILELADRNFNVWWRDFNCDPRRINIGLATYWRNPFGYNDRLRAIVQFGYIRKFELDYEFPPLSQKRPWGFGFNALYSDNKESAYDIQDNILQFYRRLNTRERQYRRLRFSLMANYRQSLFDRHSLELYYKDLQISDSLAFLNPDFFLNSSQRQQSFVLDYEYTRDRRDIISYPLSGHYVQFNILKRGLGVFDDINQLWITLRGEFYHKFSDRWSSSTVLEGRYSAIRQQQPFWQQEALGYEDSYLRGYQYYVINGQDYAFLRSDLNFKLLDYVIPLFKDAKNPYNKALPIKIHLRYHFDYGYVWDRYYQNQGILANQHLIGTGLGLDFAFYDYNFVTQIEYSFNKLGENDVYLGFKFDF